MPADSSKVTAPIIQSMKGARRIVSLTAYDVATASIADEAGVDIILVGDSAGNVIHGYDSTLPVTLQDMVGHTAAARRGCSRALLVADMPFGSYQSSVAQAVGSAVRLVKAGAEAVKLEGLYVEEIRAIVKAGIPVMGHIGMTPQSVNRFGGFRMQGKGSEGADVLEAARAVAEAGAFSMVIELIPHALAREITCSVPCPTIGIGAGPHCDGQVQVFHDLLGLSTVRLKHVKVYCEGRQLFEDAIRAYASEVRANEFPLSEGDAGK